MNFELLFNIITAVITIMFAWIVLKDTSNPNYQPLSQEEAYGYPDVVEPLGED